ncbi:MAG: YdcF family protein [Oscillospiraceae bacterium]|nr:YdcF family protein [Oscillospiraceae bacterium]
MLRIENGALRIILIALCIFGFFLFFAPTTVRIVNIGNVFGMAVSIILLIFFTWNKPISHLLGVINKSKAGKICLRGIGIILLLGVLHCLVISLLMVRAAYKKPKQQPDVIIVLGCKVRGFEPSLMLSGRIQAGYDAAQQYPDAMIIVSGGKGDNEDISEAQCMAYELIRMGIPARRIIMEDASASTSENLRFSKKIMDEEGLGGTVMLVTDGFHEFRAQILAEKEGLSGCTAASAKTPAYLLPTYWVREWFGVAHAIAFGT